MHSNPETNRKDMSVTPPGGGSDEVMLGGEANQNSHAMLFDTPTCEKTVLHSA